MGPGENTLAFPVENLELNPTEFSVVLDTSDSDTLGLLSVVTHVQYSDDQGNSPGMGRLMIAKWSSLVECNEDDTRTAEGPAIGKSISRNRILEEEEDGNEEEDFDCSPCEDLSEAEMEELAKYDNGGKFVVCDPTCLDGVSDPIHCNCEFLPNVSGKSDGSWRLWSRLCRECFIRSARRSFLV